LRIGLISDTHLPALGKEPPHEVARAFDGVDLILHAGDIYNADCLDWLERIAPVIAVEVPPAPVWGDPRVADRRVLALEGHRIGLVHDLAIRGCDEVIPGALERDFPSGTSVQAALEPFFGEPVDAVVFGHSHIAVAETHQGILFVNPGSPTLPRQVRRLGSVGIMELRANSRDGWIVELASLRAD
jgi:putative phosphoesterase